MNDMFYKFSKISILHIAKKFLCICQNKENQYKLQYDCVGFIDIVLQKIGLILNTMSNIKTSNFKGIALTQLVQLNTINTYQ
jgi:hypothetical protein